MSGLSQFPPLDAVTLPRSVRAASSQDQQTYRAALAFERMLVSQLTQSLQGTLGGAPGAAGDDQEGGAGQDGGPYASLLPGALTDGLMAGGGLGLAEPLWQAMRASSGSEAAGTDAALSGSTASDPTAAQGGAR